MSETLYLIAHKVRGQPAFDVAIQMPMDDEVWWIIPTSGHRAYPYWFATLRIGDYPSLSETPFLDSMPHDLPDHYAANDRLAVGPAERKPSLLEALGIKPTLPNLTRRPL